MNHLGDTNKMVSETPRMDASAYDDGVVWDTGCDIERELNTAHESLLFAREVHIQKQIALDKANHRIQRLEAVVNDPHALWINWLRGDVKLPVGIGDVRQYQDRIKQLEEAGDEAIHEAAHGREDDALEIWNKAKEDKL